MDVDGASRLPTHSKDAHYRHAKSPCQTFAIGAQKKGLARAPFSVVAEAVTESEFDAELQGGCPSAARIPWIIRFTMIMTAGATTSSEKTFGATVVKRVDKARIFF